MLVSYRVSLALLHSWKARRMNNDIERHREEDVTDDEEEDVTDDNKEDVTDDEEWLPDYTRPSRVLVADGRKSKCASAVVPTAVSPASGSTRDAEGLCSPIAAFHEEPKALHPILEASYRSSYPAGSRATVYPPEGGCLPYVKSRLYGHRVLLDETEEAHLKRLNREMQYRHRNANVLKRIENALGIKGNPLAAPAVILRRSSRHRPTQPASTSDEPPSAQATPTPSPPQLESTLVDVAAPPPGERFVILERDRLEVGPSGADRPPGPALLQLRHYTDYSHRCQLEFMRIIQNYPVVYSKSHTWEARKTKWDAFLKIQKSYESTFGKKIKTQQLIRKLYLMKARLKQKTVVIKTGNKEIVLKDWEKILLKMLEGDMHAVIDKVPGESAAGIVGTSRADIPPPSVANEVVVDSHDSREVERIHDKDHLETPLHCTLDSTQSTSREREHNVLEEYETEETRSLSMRELQRLVLLKQLAVLILKEKKLLLD